MHCGGTKVYPTGWEQEGTNHWWVELECPECWRTREGVFARDDVLDLDEAMARAERSVRWDLARIEQSNQEEDLAALARVIPLFARALQEDLISAADFLTRGPLPVRVAAGTVPPTLFPGRPARHSKLGPRGRKGSSTPNERKHPMRRTLPKVGTRLRPYDSFRRYRATVIGYAKVRGEKKVKLRHETGQETTASLAHLSRTFYAW
jgi:hypothetical protein